MEILAFFCDDVFYNNKAKAPSKNAEPVTATFAAALGVTGTAEGLIVSLPADVGDSVMSLTNVEYMDAFKANSGSNVTSPQDENDTATELMPASVSIVNDTRTWYT